MPSAWQLYKEKIASTRNADELTKVVDNLSLEKIDQDISNARLDICRECPLFVSYTSQCSQCGCFMPTRVEFKDSTCPVNKW